MADQITALPTPPSTSDPANFASEADAFLGALPTFATQLNAYAAALNSLSTTTASTTSIAIGTGTKNFTVETGKSLFVGMSYKMAYDANNWMLGDIISYNSGTGALSIDIDTVRGSGTYAAWAGTLSFNGQVENSQLANGYINDLVEVTFDHDADFVSIADTSDSGNKKKSKIRGLVSRILQPSTSVTAIDFTSIPSGTKRITIQFSGVSTSGTSIPQIQIGDSGGIETSGYSGAGISLAAVNTVAGTNNSSGFLVAGDHAASVVFHGSVTLTLIDAATNLWEASVILGRSSTSSGSIGGGTKSLSATLDRVRISTVNGTDTFDAGSINILYE